MFIILEPFLKLALEIVKFEIKTFGEFIISKIAEEVMLIASNTKLVIFTDLHALSFL